MGTLTNLAIIRILIRSKVKRGIIVPTAQGRVQTMRLTIARQRKHKEDALQLQKAAPIMPKQPSQQEGTQRSRSSHSSRCG